jgi:YhcH/YjgK/YiaL family protein
MVIDTLANSARYECLHPRFKAAFAFLRRADLDAIALGRTEIDGSALFALTQAYETKPIQEGKLEAHRKYIDIQFILEGEEFIGYAPLGGQPVSKPFDAEKDIGFYDGEAWFTRLRKGMFAIFFPEDAHLPSRHTDKPFQVKKIVLKIER